MIFTPKYSCVNCVYLHKVKHDVYNQPVPMDLTAPERERLKKEGNIKLARGEGLRCYRNQWVSEYNTEPEKKENRLIRKRKRCKKEDYYYPYSPGKDLHQLKREHDKEREKEKISPFDIPGWGWKVVSILQDLREWFFRFFE